MDLKTLTIEQLKALAYDLIVQSDQNKHNLMMINKELDARLKAKEVKDKEQKDPKEKEEIKK